MNNKNNMIMLILGVVILCLLIVGGTYAYMTFSITATNGKYNGSTTCFIIDYDIKNSDGTSPITGTMYPSSGASGGLSGKVSMKINANCNVNGTGSLSLNVVSGGSALFQTVSGHCENSKTLKTMTDYATSSTCTAQTNGKWVSNGTALKYAVYNTASPTSTTQPLSAGYITGTGDIKIYDGFALSKTAVNYYIFVWLDGNISDNSYASLSFNGYIHAGATQNDT